MAIQYTVLVRKDDLECITMHSTFQKGWHRMSYNAQYLL
jgi:hypothetical protein